MEDIPLSMDSAALLTLLGDYGYIHDKLVQPNCANYRINSVHRLDWDYTADGGSKFSGYELRGHTGATGRYREYAYYAWYIPDQQVIFSDKNRHELVDDEGKPVTIALYIDNGLSKPVGKHLFTYVHSRRRDQLGLDNRGYEAMEVEMLERCAVKS